MPRKVKKIKTDRPSLWVYINHNGVAIPRVIYPDGTLDCMIYDEYEFTRTKHTQEDIFGLMTPEYFGEFVSYL